MVKSSVISARIDPETKQAAEQVFKHLGLTASQAITLFYRQVQLQQGMPFALKLPTRATLKALEEAGSASKLPAFETAEALFEDLGM